MMKINQKLLSIAVLGAIIGLASCNDDDSGSKLSKDDAKGKIEEFNSTAVSDLQELSNADGMAAVKDLFNLVDTDDPFTGRIGTDKKSIKRFFREKGKDFKTIFIPRSINGRTADDAFDFNSKKGIYTWNAEQNVFTVTGESDIISILFPTEGSSTNNAELQITAYTEKEFYDEEYQEYYYNPEVLKAGLFVNEVKVASIDLDIEWNDDAFPTAVDVTLFVSPFTANITFNGTSTTSTLATSLKKNDDILVATNVTVKFDDESKSSESINTVTGYVQLKNMKIQGSIDVKAADQSETGDLNEYIHLALYADNSKVGDIVFVKEVVDDNEEFVPYLKYNDGSQEKLEEVLQPVVDELNALFEDLDDNG
jgi:hypothetical protein